VRRRVDDATSGRERVLERAPVSGAEMQGVRHGTITEKKGGVGQDLAQLREHRARGRPIGERGLSKTLFDGLPAATPERPRQVPHDPAGSTEPGLRDGTGDVDAHPGEHVEDIVLASLPRRPGTSET
jgi:hypothetical protein